MKWNKVCIIFSQKIPSIARPGALVKAMAWVCKGPGSEMIDDRNNLAAVHDQFVVFCSVQVGLSKSHHSFNNFWLCDSMFVRHTCASCSAMCVIGHNCIKATRVVAKWPDCVWSEWFVNELFLLVRVYNALIWKNGGFYFRVWDCNAWQWISGRSAVDSSQVIIFMS